VASCRLPLGIPRRSLFAIGHLDGCLRLDSDGLGETGDGAFMTDQAVAFDNNFENDCVIVAIGGGGDDAQAVAAGFAFHPELLAGAAPEGDEAGFEGFGVAGFIEEAEHEDFACGVVLYDAGDEAVHFFEIYLGLFGGHLDSRCEVWLG